MLRNGLQAYDISALTCLIFGVHQYMFDVHMVLWYKIHAQIYEKFNLNKAPSRTGHVTMHIGWTLPFYKKNS